MARSTLPVDATANVFSPHTRGWPGGHLPEHRADDEFSPHTRGWPGAGSDRAERGAGFSPHTRGWPGLERAGEIAGECSPRTRGDGPANGPAVISVLKRSPRTRGDGPNKGQPTCVQQRFSPHTRGWPELITGMVRLGGRSPRTRGDGPWTHRARRPEELRSPRTRGDGPTYPAGDDGWKRVLPAHAGMAREKEQGTDNLREFSPHTRGWPEARVGRGQIAKRSPRTRGDGPGVFMVVVQGYRVLPAHAGMARSGCAYEPRLAWFSPHTRGWPEMPWRGGGGPGSSPRTRGDGPLYGSLHSCASFVLPAHAGMARSRTGREGVRDLFSPHTRGWPAGRQSASEENPRSPRTRGDGPGLTR